MSFHVKWELALPQHTPCLPQKPSAHGPASPGGARVSLRTRADCGMHTSFPGSRGLLPGDLLPGKVEEPRAWAPPGSHGAGQLRCTLSGALLLPEHLSLLTRWYNWAARLSKSFRSSLQLSSFPRHNNFTVTFLIFLQSQSRIAFNQNLSNAFWIMHQPKIVSSSQRNHFLFLSMFFCTVKE